MADVFISYARANEAAARRVATALKSAGFQVWSDEQLPAHRAYSEIIEQRLSEAKAVVVLWSEQAAQSQWVRAEADYARNQGKLVQARLDEQLPPMPFNQVQCANLKGWRGKAGHAGWAKLVESVGELVSGTAPEPARPAPRRWFAGTLPKLGIGLAAVLALAAALFLSLGWLDRGPAERPVLAVLPFVSLDQRDASLVSGIWEDTRQALSRNPQLLVLGPNTAEELAKKGMEVSRRAADYVLEASVRSVGDRIRVSTNLVRTDDGAQLWSENFDRKLDDVFALQTEIAGAIEGRIRGRLAERGGVMPQNIATSGEVYALYSDARAKIRKRDFTTYDDAYQQLSQVVRMDPNFAPGWATLAVIKKFGISGNVEETSGASAEADARRAVALAPNLAAAHAALGFVLGPGPAAEAQLRRAVQLDPNDFEALHWLANSLDKSRNNERLQLYSKVTEIEPLWWPAVLAKLSVLFDTGDLRAAEQELARLERLGDTRLATATNMSIAVRKGDLSAAVDAGLAFYRSASPADRDFIKIFLIQPLFQLGLMDIADELSPPPSHFIPLIRANDPRVLDIFESEMGPQRFWTYGLLATVGARVYLLNDQGPRLAKLYRAVASSPEEFEAVVGEDRLVEIAPGAALALRSAGDDDQARQLLAIAEKGVPPVARATFDEQISLARIYAVQGKTDQAIGLLSSAVRRGWLPPYLPIHTDIALDPPLAELKTDPRFEKIRQQILRHLAKERTELGPVGLVPTAAAATKGSR